MDDFQLPGHRHVVKRLPGDDFNLGYFSHSKEVNLGKSLMMTCKDCLYDATSNI